MANNKTNLDSILTFIFLKKLMAPIIKTDAYSMELVNNVGKVIKVPETEEEKNALTVLDKFVFKLKRLLGSKMSQLNNFLFLQTLNNDLYNKLIVKGSIQQRAEIKRIQRDIDKLQEKYEAELSDILYGLLNEEIRNYEI